MLFILPPWHFLYRQAFSFFYKCHSEQALKKAAKELSFPLIHYWHVLYLPFWWFHTVALWFHTYMSVLPKTGQAPVWKQKLYCRKALLNQSASVENPHDRRYPESFDDRTVAMPYPWGFGHILLTKAVKKPYVLLLPHLTQGPTTTMRPT